MRNFFARPIALPGHLYWSWLFTESNSSYVTVRSAEMHDVIGGPSVCSGGLASADSVYPGGYYADYAFDDPATSSQWTSQSGLPHRLTYRFPVPVLIVEYSLMAKAYDVGDAPRSWQFQYSDDGETWTTVNTQTGLSFASAETKTFVI